MWKGSFIENMFAARDPVYHKRIKGSVAQWYSLSNLRQMEGLVDLCSVEFLAAMQDLAGQPVDIGQWVQWYAFDVIGQLTFLQPFGFLRDRGDKGGVIHGIDLNMIYTTIVGQLPEINK